MVRLHFHFRTIEYIIHNIITASKVAQKLESVTREIVKMSYYSCCKHNKL